MMEHPNYVDVQAMDHWAPLGPWKATTPSMLSTILKHRLVDLSHTPPLLDDWTEHPNFNIAAEMSRDSFIVSRPTSLVVSLLLSA